MYDKYMLTLTYVWYVQKLQAATNKSNIRKLNVKLQYDGIWCTSIPLYSNVQKLKGTSKKTIIKSIEVGMRYPYCIVKYYFPFEVEMQRQYKRKLNILFDRILSVQSFETKQLENRSENLSIQHNKNVLKVTVGSI